MKVSTRVHYGLRAMTELARTYDQGGLTSIAEIARSEDLPLAYLEQLVGELRRAGLVEGTRGVHGGYRLANPPDAITVGSVYRVLEGEIAPVQCNAEDYMPGECSRELQCMSRSIWDRVQRAILNVLDSTTLRDMLEAETPTGGQFVSIDSLMSTPAKSGSSEYAHA